MGCFNQTILFVFVFRVFLRSTGEVRIWDVTDYACLATLRVPKSGAVAALAMSADGSVISGWADGFIRCYDGSLNRQLWIIPGAHRGGVTTVALKTGNDNPPRLVVITTFI